MHDAEQRRRGADPDRQRGDRADREQGCPEQHANAVLQIRENVGHWSFPEITNGGAGFSAAQRGSTFAAEPASRNWPIIFPMQASALPIGWPLLRITMCRPLDRPRTTSSAPAGGVTGS